MNIAKRLFAIILSVVSIALVSSGSPERLVTYEFCDHLEINHVYKINEGTGETKLSGKMRHVSFKWIITTHTLYDSELNNRDIVALEHRNRFIRR